MKTPLCLVFLLAAASWAQGVVPIILDTDLGPDCDDAGALAVLNALENRGEARMLAVTCNTTSEWCAPAAQAINTWYGRGQVPVGTLKGPGNPGGSAEWFGGSFNRFVAEHSPNSLRSGRNAPDAVAVYRAALKAAPDASVMIASVGNTTNLRNLLATDRELVRRKVRELVIMGGTFPVGPPKDPNLYGDIDASRTVLEQWPTPITFSGVEIGKEMWSGAALTDRTPPSNPVRMAYEKWDEYFYPRLWDKAYRPGRVKPHSSYDQTAVLYAARGLRDYWKASPRGTVVLEKDGSDRWTSQAGGMRYLMESMDRSTLGGVIEGLMVESPRARR